MNLKKTGSFFKELRNEKGLTQEQLAEHFGVSGRTVSRWETGSNMPDLAILIEMADFYEVDLRELLDGERKSESMNKDLEETVLEVADSGVTEDIASFCLGLPFGILMVSVLYTSRHMSKIRAFKKKVLHRG